MRKTVLFLVLFLSIAAAAQEHPEDIASDVSVRTNLLWAAAAEPNIAMDVRVADHVSMGIAAGLKPWPRWFFWDWDNSGDNSHWRNFAVVPQIRWWPDRVWDGWFFGADLLYTHYNVGAVNFPLRLYPEVRNHRLQGSFWGAGLFAGHSWQLADCLRIEAEAGLAGGLAAYDRFECPHCGARLGSDKKAALVPKIGINIVWHPRRKANNKSKYQ